MKIRLLYIFFAIVVIIGLRIFNNIRAEYNPTIRSIYEEVDSLFLVDSGVVCIMIPKKTYYRIGESPQLDILVINRTDSTIYLPHSLDGSDFNRLPYCNIHFIEKKIFTARNFVCINNGLMKSSDLHDLQPNEYFNPINNFTYAIDTFQSDTMFGLKEKIYAEWMRPWSPQNLKGEKFLLPGKYKIQFVYSTKPDTSGYLDWVYKSSFFDDGEEDLEFDTTLFNKIPEILIRSNIVELKYGLF